MGLRTWIYEKTGIRLKKQKKSIYAPAFDTTYKIDEEFQQVGNGSAAMQKLLREYSFQTVLDVGAGVMKHSALFAKYGKLVTALDYGNSPDSLYDKNSITRIICDFNEYEFNEQFDCVWSSHSLEHQLSDHYFLKKLINTTKEGGILAITVPPFKHEIVAGHVSLWNAGLLLYRLVIAGIDCSNAAILSYGYNISVIVEKKSIETEGISYVTAHMQKIKQYLPNGLEYSSTDGDCYFDGNISRLNW